MNRRALLLGVLAPGCTGMIQEQKRLNAQLDREVVALQMENARLRDQACEPAAESAPIIYNELLQVFSGTEVQVRRDRDEVFVEVPGTVVWVSGAARVRGEAEMVFDLVSTALNLHSERMVEVVAFTDDQLPPSNVRKQYPTNWEFSAARAAAVVRTFVEEYGVSPHRFAASGRAEWEPVADNATPEGREANRRLRLRLWVPAG